MKDHLVKAVADGVRVYAAVTTDLVNEAIRRHGCHAVAAAALGRTMTGALLLAANLKNREALTITFDGHGPLGRVTADATPEGFVRGYVTNPYVDLPQNAKGKIDVGGGVGTDGTVTVTRFTGLRNPVTGSAPLTDGEIADDLTKYLYVSEQTPSSVGLGVLIGHAGEEMACYVNDFSKPVVVSSASVNASAAYEISSQADYIFTAKTTAIGAIGTAMQVTDLSGLLDKLGISVENITSAESKDSSYGTRPLTEEERAYYQAMVDTVNETFMETVASGRSLPIERVRELATGLTYTGIDAVQNGLADEIGTREDAIAKAAELAGMRTYAVVSLEPESDDLSDLVGLLSSSKMSNEDLIERLKELNGNGSQH